MSSQVGKLGPEVILTVILYGSSSRDPSGVEERFSKDAVEQRRLELQLRPRIPIEAMASMEAKTRWMDQFLKSIGTDVKHSRNWRCEFCSEHARETIWMNASWLHLQPPRQNAYVHNVCNSFEGPCADYLEQVNKDMAVLTGMPGQSKGGTRNSRRPPPGSVYPMSATCIVCNNEELSSRKHLKQCTQCKVTRYCGQECQRKDWKRHKTFCKTVHDVKWVWDTNSRPDGKSGAGSNNTS
ncbi:hypothetical protein D9758_005436 [Tetrapyrgos nigripes]|uniref:MYND-type domain-containing protein n=1 Tax=Tetrapyrgos nigripes TaxID=182062 RepID=A0A8H5LQ41_9AGAR|nr:hypothetical protein D9758_005436 [Tetrapyrgos nigripes]